MLLCGFVYLNLFVDLLDLNFMFPLSSFQFLYVINIDLFPVFVDTILPDSKRLILNQLVDSFDRSEKECLCLSVLFDVVFPCSKAVFFDFMASDIPKPSDLASDVFDTFDFTDLLFVLVEGVAELSASNCF